VTDSHESASTSRRLRLTPAMADVRRAVREWAETGPEVPGGLFLVALSGGSDSLALAWAAGLELPKLGFGAGAIIVDHQLQEASSEVAAHAAEQATKLGLNPVVTKAVVVGTTGGPEDAARFARYQAFTEALHETGAEGILLAHTEDDQAETVLLGLARGSGPSSLKGMAQRDGRYHRPLLSLPRATVRQALGDADIAWFEDPHNVDPSYARVRVRHTVLPVLEENLGPGITPALARTADLFRADSEALDSLAERIFDRVVTRRSTNTVRVPVADIEGEPNALVSRVIRMMVAAAGGVAPTYPQMRQILALVREWKGQSAVSVAGASVVRKDNSILVSGAPER
jgi:tRNA(Ile)-lysidine synthase